MCDTRSHTCDAREMSLRVQLHLQTEFISEVFSVCLSSTRTTVGELLKLAAKQYDDWHPFPVDLFELRVDSSAAALVHSTPLSMLLPEAATRYASLTLQMTEASCSVNARREAQAAEMRARAAREQAEQEAERARLAKIAAIESSGWASKPDCLCFCSKH